MSVVIGVILVFLINGGWYLIGDWILRRQIKK